MVSMDSVEMAPSVRILLVVSVVPVLLDSLEIQGILALTLMNVPFFMVHLESVLFLLHVPTLLDPSFVNVHLEHLVILSLNVHLSHHLIRVKTPIVVIMQPVNLIPLVNQLVSVILDSSPDLTKLPDVLVCIFCNYFLIS